MYGGIYMSIVEIPPTFHIQISTNHLTLYHVWFVFIQCLYLPSLS